MYRPGLTLRERAVPLGAVVLIHVGLAYGLLHLSGADVELARQADLLIFDVPPETPPPPPPPPLPPPSVPVEKVAPKQAQPKQDAGEASPRNIVSKATPVVAPKPRIVVPPLTTVVAAITPSTGAAATQGASSVIGPGTGAGGLGTGSGSGGAGSGPGGGGSGGAGGLPPSRPRIVESTKLTSRDYPDAAIRAWPRRARVFVQVKVQLDGRATDCRVNRSSGVEGIDADTCRLVMARVRFTPARDERGQPTVDYYGYVQEPSGR